MEPTIILYFIAIYFALLLGISWYTSRGSTSETFFNADHKSPWYIVAFGMVGTSLSGVTMVSVTGKVVSSQWGYLHMVLGFFAGYFIIAFVLLPLYYRLKLTSIYQYLSIRFGKASSRTGSLYFILSRSMGAAARLYLAVIVLDGLVFRELGLPFNVTVAIILLLIFIYTFQSGIKTIIWTDTLQTLLLLGAIVLSFLALTNLLGGSFSEINSQVSAQHFTDIFPKGWGAALKGFFAGICICVTMTGLDQGMMQRSLSCPSLRDAQKNIISFAVVLVLVNLLFMYIGAMLGLFCVKNGLSFATADEIFPSIANNYFGVAAAAMFVLGLIAATFSSCDDALAALTTSFSLDILRLDPAHPETERKRKTVHLGFAVLMFFIIILAFKGSSMAVIDMVLNIGSITYGPLLGLFVFGMATRKRVKDHYVPIIAIVSPIVIMGLSAYAGWLSLQHTLDLLTLDLWTPAAWWKLIFTSVSTEIIIYIAGLTFLLLYLFSDIRLMVDEEPTSPQPLSTGEGQMQ
ncbi:MAG: sodium:solute symporter [Flavobacteriaceae bacterium]|nr:sodium:solute symporter [Flavobacteriaceae bacterium]